MTGLCLIALAVLIQAYVGYPLSLTLLRLVLGRRARHAQGAGTPSITLVISAYNEGLAIRQKIENSLALDYPVDRLRCIVVSDGSSDATNPIVREYADRGIELRCFPDRQGKVACLNQVIPTLTSELVVMSDANSIYDKQSLRKLVRHFADERTGCVCGLLSYVNPRKLLSGEGERLYWSYETCIKALESGLGSLLGANGAIYAYRRALFRPVDPLMFCDDVVPIRIALAGYLTIFDPEARCSEEAADERVEMRRRARHASFGMRSMGEVAAEALKRGRLLILYQCVSHRVLRWAGGACLIVLLLGTPFLPHPWAGVAATAQALLYAGAAAGYLASRSGLRLTLLYLPYYFLAISAAGLAGLGSLLLGRDTPYWEPRR